MAPRLPPSKLAMIRDMILSKSLTTSQMAEAAECSERSIINISNNLRRFGNARAPPTRVGRRPSVTPPMLEALCHHLFVKPGLYVDEMAIFLWDEFRVQVTSSSLKRALASVGWSKKVARQRAMEQNADLRDFYLHNLSDFRSYHLVYVDESGCDKRIGFRRTGWSPAGTTPLQVSKFHRDQRYQILPAYTQDGVVFSRVFQGSTDATVFEDFIKQLLRHCGKWPEPKSVLVMDNASFHHSERIKEICTNAGVKLVYLPPYSPDLNPIEEFFSELKAFIRRSWRRYEQSQDQGSGAFLEWCLEVVGSRERSAMGHFRQARVVLEDCP
jgi:transposase